MESLSDLHSFLAETEYITIANKSNSIFSFGFDLGKSIENIGGNLQFHWISYDLPRLISLLFSGRNGA